MWEPGPVEFPVCSFGPFLWLTPYTEDLCRGGRVVRVNAAHRTHVPVKGGLLRLSLEPLLRGWEIDCRLGLGGRMGELCCLLPGCAEVWAAGREPCHLTRCSCHKTPNRRSQETNGTTSIRISLADFCCCFWHRVLLCKPRLTSNSKSSYLCIWSWDYRHVPPSLTP
jgi:hypothetical protein